MKFCCLVLSAAVSAATWISSSASGQFVPGDLYISAYQKIYHVDPTNWTFSVFADIGDGLTDAGGVAFSGRNALLRSDGATDQVLEFDAAGNVSGLYDATDGLALPSGIAYDAAGNLLVVNSAIPEVLSFPAGGGAPNVVADASDGLYIPGDVAVAPDGTVFVLEWYTGDVWSIDANGNVSSFDTLPQPATIAIRGNGDIYVASYDGKSSETIYRYPSGIASQRVVLAAFPGVVGWGEVQLSVDGKTVYFASFDELFTVDADTGSTNKVIDSKQGLRDCWAIAVFPQLASWSNYGTGFPGSNGIPAFTSAVDPVLGTTVTVDVANSYGQPTVGWMFVGVQQADIHTSRGGDLLVEPLFTLPITFSFGSDSFSVGIPNNPHLGGAKLELQVLEADPGAAKGVSFTQGLELVVGY